METAEANGLGKLCPVPSPWKPLLCLLAKWWEAQVHYPGPHAHLTAPLVEGTNPVVFTTQSLQEGTRLLWRWSAGLPGLSPVGFVFMHFHILPGRTSEMPSCAQEPRPCEAPSSVPSPCEVLLCFLLLEYVGQPQAAGSTSWKTLRVRGWACTGCLLCVFRCHAVPWDTPSGPWPWVSDTCFDTLAFPFCLLSCAIVTPLFFQVFLSWWFSNLDITLE